MFDQHSRLSEHKNKTKVMLNGNWIGFMNGEPHVLVDFIKEGRSTGLIPDEISVVRDIVQKEIKIYTDSGRCMRPLFKVEHNHLKLTMDHINEGFTMESLKREDVIEFLDVEEEESSLIAMDLSYLKKS